MVETVIKNGKSFKTAVIFQPSRLSNVNLASDFSLGTSYFMIKVNGDAPVSLDVIYAEGSEVITTFFFPGWNPDLIRTIKAGSATNIQIGF